MITSAIKKQTSVYCSISLNPRLDFMFFTPPRFFFMYFFSAYLFNSQIIAFEKAPLHEDYIKVSKSLWDTARLAQKLLSIIIAGYPKAKVGNWHIH